MIAVVPYRQEYNVCDNSGRVISPKGIYVDYGVDTNTLQRVCLPAEEYYDFVARNCFLDVDSQVHIIKY